MTLEIETHCELCKSQNLIAGPLWVGKIFDKEFVENMILEISKFNINKVCEKTLKKCALESDLPGTFFTLDEIASRMKGSPLKLENAITRLQNKGFKASPTSFNPTGFRTNAKINEIISIFST